MLWGLLFAALGMGQSCTQAYIQSLGGDETQAVERLYTTDLDIAWQAVLESLKNSRLDITNREGGYIQTKWTDNTSEKNFSDSFGGGDLYLKAQFRLRIALSKGFYNGQQVVKVSVEKEQLVQRDVLDGFRPILSDTIDEKTLLYRVGRIIFMKMKLAKLEELRTKKELENTQF